MEQVAEAVGVSKATISRYEKGIISNMRRDRIAAYAAVLGMSIEQLVNEQEDEKVKSADGLAVIVKSLDGLTYLEWLKLREIVDECFDQKQREFKRTLELHADDDQVNEAIRSRFVGKWD